MLWLRRHAPGDFFTILYDAEFGTEKGGPEAALRPKRNGY